MSNTYYKSQEAQITIR